MKRLALLLVMCACVVQAQAFDATRARQILNTIASDDFEGRRPGFPGGVKTEDYLAQNLRVCGVQPGGMGGFFQAVPLLITEEQDAELTLMDHELGKIPFLLGADFTVVTHSGSGSLVASVVMVGYGYVRPDKKRNDYDSIDAAGKIALIVRGTPDSPYDFQDDFSRRATLAWAKQHHAAAVLYYQDEHPVNGAAIPADCYDPDFPILYVGGRFLSLLLDGTGYTVETYIEKLKQQPLPLDTKKRVYLSTTVHKKSTQSARNVLGIVYGTDPVLKNEVIVLAAHWDHLGKNAHGVIYNGADDNGSGTAVAAELARCLAANPTKRSVLIGHFCAEEDGLLGSTYFVEHPTIPFGNIAGTINLDMDGMGNGKVAMSGGETFAGVWDDYRRELDSLTLERLAFNREDGHGASDYAGFSRAGSPAIAFWSRGTHNHYHHYEDDARWISDSALAAVGNRAEDFVRFLGNHDGSLACHADSARIMARLALHVDFTGTSLDAQSTIPELNALSTLWLPRDGAVTFAEASRRIADLQSACANRKIAVGTIKETMKNYRHHENAVMIGMSEADLALRKTAEIQALVRQGVSLVKLATGTSPTERNTTTEALDAARKAGIFALVPLDFAAPTRVTKWKNQAIVHGTLKDFAALPGSVRDGLLNSDALVLLDASETPTPEQIATLAPGMERRLHISFGSLPLRRREEHARAIMQAFFNAGLARNDILLLTGGNLKRFTD